MCSSDLAVSFFGYVAVRVMGAERGIVLASVAGALVSSTTVTLNNSRLAAKNPKGENALLAIAICTAWVTSLARMTAIAVVVNPVMLGALAPSILASLGVLLLAILFLYFRSGAEKASADLSFDNPLDLTFVLKFGALLSVVVVGATLLGNVFGQAGVLGLAGVSDSPTSIRSRCRLRVSRDRRSRRATPRARYCLRRRPIW